MSFLELYASPPVQGVGSCRSFSEAQYIMLGVPFDFTSSFRSGSRFAPNAIRQASFNLETYSLRSNMDMGDLKIYDAGDLNVTSKVGNMLKRVSLVAKEILNKNKIPIFIGGEHTIALGVTSGIDDDFAIISFDAHLDLRNEYMDRKFCHATVIRRINERLNPLKTIEIGIRSACNEEIEYASKEGIQYISSYEILRNGVEKAGIEIKNLLHDYKKIYLTVDIDVLDPAFAPAVQNPEPEGLSTFELLQITSNIDSRKLIGFDVTEVTPVYDTGATAIQAARIIYELICYVHKREG